MYRMNASGFLARWMAALELILSMSEAYISSNQDSCSRETNNIVGLPRDSMVVTVVAELVQYQALRRLSWRRRLSRVSKVSSCLSVLVVQ